ncbi:MAG: Rpp14/Pop5 family protein [Candidatus Micrarchaeota archaeon]|nr:Rpp14/Pop5 family protein [Candidatus Micrarchaeota archaeon]
MVEASENVSLGDSVKQEMLKSGMKAFLGELPFFKANPQVAAQLSDRVFVVSVNRGYERNIALALSFVKELDGRRMGFYTIRTSGTIRSIKDAFGELY